MSVVQQVLHGVFSVYKPKGWTSRKATDFVQFALSNELWNQHYKNQVDPPRLKRRDRIKIGHGGTLVNQVYINCLICLLNCDIIN
jgi:tRNA pseudouridine55 synthase